jgi:hypothetical protein
MGRCFSGFTPEKRSQSVSRDCVFKRSLAASALYTRGVGRALSAVACQPGLVADMSDSLVAGGGCGNEAA